MVNSSPFFDDESNKYMLHLVIFLFLVTIFSFFGENTYFSKTDASGRRKIFWNRVFGISFLVMILMYIVLYFLFDDTDEPLSGSKNKNNVKIEKRFDGSKSFIYIPGSSSEANSNSKYKYSLRPVKSS